MKSILISLTLLSGTAVFAQGFHGRAANSTPPTPQQMAQNETNRLTKFFSLTTTQQSAVLGFLTTADTQIANLHSQIQPLHTSLVAAIKANNSEQINALLGQISPLQEQISSAQAIAAGQIYATVLTATQQGQIPNGLGPLMMMGPMGGGGFRGR